MDPSGAALEECCTATKRERRLRSMLRHERMTVAMALAEKLHHSSRGQKMARGRGGRSRDALHGHVPDASPSPGGRHPVLNDLFAAGGSRPDRLTEVRPQERVQRHTVEQIILAPMLDVPVPLMEEQLLGRCLRATRYPCPRAGYRSAQDPHRRALSANSCSRDAAGGTASGSTDDHLLLPIHISDLLLLLWLLWFGTRLRVRV